MRAVPETASPFQEEGERVAVNRPEILAPAGDVRAALAGLAAGADAVYLGLKHFSARMQSENFATGELCAVTEMARDKGRRIYVAMNTLVKPKESAKAISLIRRLADDVKPHALIVQDLAMLELASQAGFQGELHLSTLANITHPLALQSAHQLGASRVILPRELSFDEIALMNNACPPGLALELFVHGALCWCVSGRCWWSSLMGGKSGLRGRCVQPCRRVYTQKGRTGRFFSSLDLSLDAHVRELLQLSRIRSWKIEGRKKSPHYVYHVTKAYCFLRDHGDDPAAREEARALLGMALGRSGTKARFINPEANDPSALANSGDGGSGSGLLCGRVGKSEDGSAALRPRYDLFPGDLLRVGVEDEAWHCTIGLAKPYPAGQPFTLPLPGNKRPKPGTSVTLIDRKDAALNTLLRQLEKELAVFAQRRRKATTPPDRNPLLPEPYHAPGKASVLEINVLSSVPHGREAASGVRPGSVQGLWLSAKVARTISRTLYHRISWWMPPVIWPDEDEHWKRLIRSMLRDGARHFVLNTPWQTAFFQDAGGIVLTAGPFCNIANAHALGMLRSMGFQAAIVSPELGSEDVLSLPGQSPLPLGIVLSGFWPAGVSRFRAEALKVQDPFRSPKGEEFWMRRYGTNTWLYPAWPLDLSAHRHELERAGYTTFIHLHEHPPKTLTQTKRPGEFNWNIDVL